MTDHGHMSVEDPGSLQVSKIKQAIYNIQPTDWIYVYGGQVSCGRWWSLLKHTLHLSHTSCLDYWGRVAHIWFTICSDNGLAIVRYQAISVSFCSNWGFFIDRYTRLWKWRLQNDHLISVSVCYIRIIPILPMWPRSQTARQIRSFGRGPMPVMVAVYRPV